MWMNFLLRTLAWQTLLELSSEITKGLEIIPVSQMEEVLKIALMRTRRKKDGN